MNETLNKNVFFTLTNVELEEISGGCGCEADGTSCHCGNTEIDTNIGVSIKGDK